MRARAESQVRIGGQDLYDRESCLNWEGRIVSDDQMPTPVKRQYLGYRIVRLLLKPVCLVLAAVVVYITLEYLPGASGLAGPPTITNIAMVVLAYGVVLAVIKWLLRRNLSRTVDAQIAAHTAGAASVGAWYFMLGADINPSGGSFGHGAGDYGGGHGAGDFGAGGFDGGGGGDGGGGAM